MYVFHFLHFVSLVGIPVDATRSAVKIKIWAITAGIRKYKSIIGKNRPYSLISKNVKYYQHFNF